MTGDNRDKSITRWKIIAGIAVGALIAGVVYHNLKSGMTVSKLSVPGMVELEFAGREGLGSVAQPTPADEKALQENQSRLETKLTELEHRLAERAAPGNAPAPPVLSDETPQPTHAASIAGQWLSPQGLTYVIQQSGDYVTMQEFNPMLGITAVGEGRVQGQQVNIAYTTAVGTFGQASLRLSDDGRVLSGQSRDTASGFVMNVQMHR